MKVGFQLPSVLTALNSASVIPSAKGCPGSDIESSYRMWIFFTLTWTLSTMAVTKLAVKLWFFCCSSALIPSVLRSFNNSALSILTAWALRSSSSASYSASSFGAARRKTSSILTFKGLPRRFDQGIDNVSDPRWPSTTFNGSRSWSSASLRSSRFRSLTSPDQIPTFNCFASKFWTYMPKNRLRRFATRPSSMATVGDRDPGRGVRERRGERRGQERGRGGDIGGR